MPTFFAKIKEEPEEFYRVGCAGEVTFRHIEWGTGAMEAKNSSWDLSKGPGGRRPGGSRTSKLQRGEGGGAVDKNLELKTTPSKFFERRQKVKKIETSTWRATERKKKRKTEELQSGRRNLERREGRGPIQLRLGKEHWSATFGQFEIGKNQSWAPRKALCSWGKGKRRTGVEAPT